MDKLTFYEIDKILMDLDDRKSSHFNFTDVLEVMNFGDITYELDGYPIEQLGRVQLVATDDKERDGYNQESIWSVIYFEDHDVYMKVFGFWSSYSGVQFEKTKEVRPTTKTITVYE